MADFEAPSGPPPPRVPEGWIARWNDQYKEWFYVNTYTKKSQWEKPTEPAKPHTDDAPPGAPPAYVAGSGPTPTDSKTNPFAHDNKTGGASGTESEDAKLARRLQEEEDARSRGSPGGAAASYANSASPGGGSNQFPGQLPPRPDSQGGDKSRGLLGKIFGGNKNKYGQPQQGYGGGYPGQQQAYGQPAYGGQPGYGYGGGPPQGYGGYGGPPPQGYYGGPPPGAYGGGGGYYQQQPQYGRQGGGGGGMGAMGGAALGLGAGVIGGALLADAFDDHGDQEAYQEGYQDGQMDDGGGGDF